MFTYVLRCCRHTISRHCRVPHTVYTDCGRGTTLDWKKYGSPRYRNQGSVTHHLGTSPCRYYTTESTNRYASTKSTVGSINGANGGNASTSEDIIIAASNENTILNPEYDGKIVQEDVDLPREFADKLAFVLYNVCSKQECEKLIEKTEAMGYEDALVNPGHGKQIMRKDIRNSGRVIWDSVKESAILFKRIRPYIPATWEGRDVHSLNERLRFLRYHPGEYFKPHFDGPYKAPDGKQTFITVQLYLNEGFSGGSTTFMDRNELERVEVVPKTGSMLIFEHHIMHEGSELLDGVKYTVRSDVLYDRRRNV